MLHRCAAGGSLACITTPSTSDTSGPLSRSMKLALAAVGLAGAAASSAQTNKGKAAVTPLAPVSSAFSLGSPFSSAAGLALDVLRDGTIDQFLHVPQLDHNAESKRGFNRSLEVA